MTQAVTVRRDGDAFQARIFWLKAAKLLADDGPIVRVGFESGPKGFDDVWVEYDPKRAPQDQFGRSLTLERLQCKWHVTPGTYTHVDLTDPEYINAKTTSLLQRAHGALKVDRANGSRTRVLLVTNHCVDPGDALRGLIRSRSNTLDLNKLFEGKTARSATGGIRQLWRQHLAIDEEELKALCATLGFSHTAESLEELRERLDETCLTYGLRTSDPNAGATIYDDIVFQWAAQGRLDFDRRSFREACGQAGLLAGPTRKSKVYGVKSFEHAFDRLEDRCERVLDLVPEFDDRAIRDDAAWHSTLTPALASFLGEAAVSSGQPRLRLALDAHVTLAFVAGAVLNTKSGRLVEIEQRTPDRQVWAPDDATPSTDWADWELTTHELNAHAQGLAVAVALTHDVEPKVREYLGKKDSPPRRLLVAKPRGGPSQRAVLGGAHADRLAEALVRHVKAQRESSGAGEEPIHLFIAGPNAFTCYLGRHVNSLKPLTLYEFDFESQRDRSYQASLSLP